MKRIPVQRWSAHLFSSKARPCCLRWQQHCGNLVHNEISGKHIRSKALSTSTATESDVIFEDMDLVGDESITTVDTSDLPSPSPEAALSSAKLAALHARISLPHSLPVQTLSRALIDSTADPSPDFNNAYLAQIGQTLLSFHVTEWLMTTYPRLPMTVLFSALNAYIGPATLLKIGREWGVEAAAFPGAEVDPGLLQFVKMAPGTKLDTKSVTRPGQDFYRRGVSSRVIYDNEFGELVTEKENAQSRGATTEDAYAAFVRALIGAVYSHAGSNATKAFVDAHVLSRSLDISKLFEFKTAIRDLSRLCAREDFEYPVARLLSETGRLSRHPVFVVGIYSGKDKLGEGSGASLNEARTRAAISGLKSWYLYSPTVGKKTMVPSDARSGDRWKSVHIDIGEIV